LGSVVKEMLVAAARALDGGRPAEARDRLLSVPLARCDRAQRLVAVALWKRVLLASFAGPSPAADVLAAFDSIAAAAANAAHVWSAYQAIPILEAELGPTDTAAMVAASLWDCVLQSDRAMFVFVFDLFFRGRGERCVPALEQYLAEQKSYVPSYWQFVLLSKCHPEKSHLDFAALASRLLRNSRRPDLAPLFDVYLKQMRQAPVNEIAAAVRALPDSQRIAVAEYMAGMGYTTEELRIVTACCEELAAKSGGRELAGLMQARLANAERRWTDAIEFAKRARTDVRLGAAADLQRALALAHLNKAADAVALLDEICASTGASHFEQARATFIRVTTELIRKGAPLPEQRQPDFPAGVGRPLAQSLWVGRSLRWIERLCIKSYLDNGWRFQLYAYDEPDNVPDGCEVLDASAIIPAKDVFKEGYGSGSHAGSIGAFSDLFRYALLHKRGGMWTDTDVINCRKFEPDGKRFISTELSDAGLVTLNGAIMAAPAGDELVGRAYDRARALLASNEKMFFTRIGPYLLAEVALDLGVDTIELMPPAFLSPISWMNTATLLQPFDVLMSREDFKQAINIHVFTETWRTLGLGLDQPPSPQTFLGRLYADRLGEASGLPERMRA
jgi:Glycosyltransferase sugar-binding region containing DXD motif